MEPELSSELAAQLAGQGGGDAMLPGRRKQHKKRKVAAMPPQMSKSKRKKLEKLKERKEKEAKRKSLYKSLEQHNLPTAHMALLSSTKSIGQRTTLKQQLRQDLRMERAGLQATAPERLYRPVAKVTSREREEAWAGVTPQAVDVADEPHIEGGESEVQEQAQSQAQAHAANLAVPSLPATTASHMEQVGPAGGRASLEPLDLTVFHITTTKATPRCKG